MGFVREHPKGSTGSGSGFKESRKTGHGLKSYPTGRAGNRTQDSWIQGQ